MKSKISYSRAKLLADDCVRILAPFCERIAIAGSIRRKRGEVGDIEIVCIPRPVGDLFDQVRYDFFPHYVYDTLKSNTFTVESGGSKYIKAVRHGVQHDIFMTNPDCWGVIFALRTGCAEFSHRLVTPKNKGGLLPSCFRVKDGRVWAGDVVQETPEEKDFFELCGLGWIDPEKRN